MTKWYCPDCHAQVAGAGLQACPACGTLSGAPQTQTQPGILVRLLACIPGRYRLADKRASTR